MDFEGRTAKVENSAVYVIDRERKDETGPKHKLIVQKSTKTDTGIRTVQLNKKAIEALKAIQTLNGKFDYVMSNSNGKITEPRNYDRMLRSIMTRCGLKPCGAHTLRHTFASMLFRNNVDVKVVSELLGHSDVAFTYNRYVHLIKEQKQQAVEVLDSL